MDNIYLKEVSENDIDLLKEYNDDCEKNNYSFWISERRFPDVIKNWKLNQTDLSKVHFYPFWLMKGNKVIGQTILKTNIEVDEMWKNIGGNISYVIIPSNRKKGYGTKCLNLALQKCKELGLKDVLISCSINNIASKKVIENNYGILRDIVYNYSNDQEYRYDINIDESLKNFCYNNIRR